MKSRKNIFLITYTVILAMVVLWLGFRKEFTREYISNNRVAYEQKVDSVAFGYQLVQSFTPQYEGLDSIDIYVDTNSCSKDSGVLRVVIQDIKEEMVLIRDIALSELPSYGWYSVSLDEMLQCGEEYRLILESIDCLDLGPKISFYDARLAASREEMDQILTYAGMEVTNSALRLRFTYQIPVPLFAYVVYFVFGELIGVILIHNLPFVKMKEKMA